MPQVDLQTALRMFERRLVATEGQIFAIKSVLGSILAADDNLSGILRQHLAGTEAIIERGFAVASDQATREYLAAANKLISELLSEHDPSKPKLTVIDGGKPED